MYSKIPQNKVRRSMKIVSTGVAFPQSKISSLELDRKFFKPDGHIQGLTGVETRYLAENHETSAALAAKACLSALEKAGLSLNDIDLLVAACGTLDQGLPHNAALIHYELKKRQPDLVVPAIDINASCLSFLTALDMLSWPLQAGQYNRILIVSSDLASCGLDWNNLETSGSFGDGAVAAIISRGGEDSAGIIASSFKTFSEGADFCKIPGGGSRIHPARTGDYSPPNFLFQMDGKRIYRLVAQIFPNFIKDLFANAKMDLSDIDCVVPHQGSSLGLRHLTNILELPENKVVNIFPQFGNQVSASLPTALHMAIERKMLKRGQKALFVGFGAGVSLGGMVLEY